MSKLNPKFCQNSSFCFKTQFSGNKEDKTAFFYSWESVIFLENMQFEAKFSLIELDFHSNQQFTGKTEVNHKKTELKNSKLNLKMSKLSLKITKLSFPATHVASIAE